MKEQEGNGSKVYRNFTKLKDFQHGRSAYSLLHLDSGLTEFSSIFTKPLRMKTLVDINKNQNLYKSDYSNVPSSTLSLSEPLVSEISVH